MSANLVTKRIKDKALKLLEAASAIILISKVKKEDFYEPFADWIAN